MRTIVLVLLMLTAGQAWAVPREVEVTGTGLTRSDAVTNGLVEAMEQVRGVRISSLELAKTELSSTVKDDKQVTNLTAEQQSATAKLTGGYVSSYRVLSEDKGPPLTVQLAVVIEVFEPKGLGTDTRRRIAVMAFGVPGANGARGSGRRVSPVAETLRDRITAHLVQARRFAVVDRAEDAAYAQEKAILASGDAPPAERVRLGQVIGADYVLTGKFRQTAATRTEQTADLTGEVITSSTPGSGEADYQLIEIATRQIKWAAAVRITGEAAADRVGAQIANEIVQSIYPMRLIRFADPANLIINQGGDSLRPGQRYKALVLGETMTDPYTHESLGQLEEEVGVVEIRRVEPKLSYAQVVSGRLPAPSGDDVQIVLRPGAPPARVAAPARPRAPASGAAAGITKLPFDP